MKKGYFFLLISFCLALNISAHHLINLQTGEQFTQDTLPYQNNTSAHIQSFQDGKKIELSIENGKINKLKIDGKEIPEEDYDQYEDLYNLDLDDSGFRFNMGPDIEFRGLDNFNGIDGDIQDLFQKYGFEPEEGIDNFQNLFEHSWPFQQDSTSQFFNFDMGDGFSFGEGFNLPEGMMERFSQMFGEGFMNGIPGFDFEDEHIRNFKTIDETNPMIKELVEKDLVDLKQYNRLKFKDETFYINGSAQEQKVYDDIIKHLDPSLKSRLEEGEIIQLEIKGKSSGSRKIMRI